ncbi:MAG: bifunctional oligoribonuclease/PAP phosphatase NrnA [Flavobacteriales bacterium]|nr:bifunctional oligoribonuclease/PAP phosphatase NrnA [Flavobacteriales bacterium]
MTSLRHPPARLREIIFSARKIVLLTHKNPDGDALGSALGLYNFLLQKKKHPVVIVPDAYPHYFRFLPGREKMLVADKHTEVALKKVREADLLFCLDFNRTDRLGCLEAAFLERTAPALLLDHHPDPDTALWLDCLHDTSASSTSELVALFLHHVFPKDPPGADAATCLYTGMFMDTGGFMFNFTENTFRHCARMLAAGARADIFVEAVFQSNTEDRMRLMGYCLYEKLRVLPDLGLAYISLTQEEMKRFNFRKGDSESFVNLALSIGGIRMAVLISEQEDGITRLSFRSKGSLPVNDLAARYFNGGGHRNASGGQIQGNAAQAEALLVETVTRWITPFKNMA